MDLSVRSLKGFSPRSMQRARIVAGGALVLSALMVFGCASPEERRERSLKIWQETLYGAQGRYEELKTRAASTVAGIEGMSQKVQEEILDLERRIEEAQEAILSIQEGAGELSEGMKKLGDAVGGTVEEADEAIEEVVEEAVEEVEEAAS